MHEVDTRQLAYRIAERFEPNTLLWAFHTIQSSSLNYVGTSAIDCLKILVSK